MAIRTTWLPAILLTILPSFVADYLCPDHRGIKAAKLHPTSYLDGLRGIACIIVFICHYTENHHRYFIPSYGLNPEEASSPIQLPFVRIIYSGRPMVHIFFVISGFALSYKPVKAIDNHDVERCHSALASSAFRRPFRLFLPCIVSTFLIAILTQMGWLYPPQPSFFSQIADWSYNLFKTIIWPWAWDYDLRPGYDIHLWTISIEFVHSMLLFLVLFTFSPLRRDLRVLGEVGMMLYGLACGRWATFEFIGGLFLAEAQVAGWIGPTTTSGEGQISKLSPVASVYRLSCFLALIIPSWFIAGWPNENLGEPVGISFLHSLTPYPYPQMADPTSVQKFWFALSGFATVLAVCQFAPARRLLETPMAQYAGKISFAVYLCHGPVLDMISPRIMGTPYLAAHGTIDGPDFHPAIQASGVKGLVGLDTPTQRLFAWALGLFIIYPVVICTADFFWRMVDTPVIALAKNLEECCMDKATMQPRL